MFLTFHPLSTLLKYSQLILALTSVAQLVGHCPAKQKVHWFDSGSGHMPGLQAGPGACTRDN